PDAIYLSVDGGKTWTRVSGEDGEKGDTGDTGPKGDSFFESVDTTNADYILFTLANNGSTFQVPRYTGIGLTFNPTSLSLLYDEKATIQCTAGGSAEFTTDNLFVVAPAGWKADIALTRAASTGFTLTVTAPADITSGVATGEILVMLDNKKGSTTIGRIPVACTQITLGNVSKGQLAKLIGSRTDLTSITVTSGTLNDADWNAIKQNEWALRTLDLAGATYYTSNLKYVKMLYIDPVPLTTAKLPQGVKVLGIDAFVNCNNLTSIELPASLTKIGLAAFYSCSKLASITCRAAVPPEMSTSVLLDVTSLTEIQVPAESVEAYKQAYAWSAYADKIVAIPEP
ncbi:leucine-rich repeat protein, partial [Caecibacteroides pullorum]